jgi:hypothetical protein
MMKETDTTFIGNELNWMHIEEYDQVNDFLFCFKYWWFLSWLNLSTVYFYTSFLHYLSSFTNFYILSKYSCIFIRQFGQLCCIFNHDFAHSRWNICLQGNFFIISPSISPNSTLCKWWITYCTLLTWFCHLHIWYLFPVF